MSDAVQEFFKVKEGAPNLRREKEHQLWKTWNENDRSKEHLKPLLDVFDPVVAAKIREWKAPRTNESAFRAEIHKHMIKAFEDYNPEHARGASLRTHIENRIKKAMRFNAKVQNFAYIPEEPARFIGKINRATDELKEEYGRDPTHDEIAKQVNQTDSKAKLTGKKVKDIITFQRNDRVGSEWTYDPVARVSNREQEVLSLIQAELPAVFPNADDRMVFEHIYGINGRQQISGTNELAKKLGKSASQISRIKSSVGNKVKTYL